MSISIAAYNDGNINGTLLDDWLQNICNSKFWDNNLTWNTNKPTLTECFIDTALIWPPVIFIWINFPYTMYNYMHSDRPPIAYNLYNVIKKGLAILMTIMEFIHAIHATIIMIRQHNSAFYISRAHLIALWLTGASYLLMIFYLHFQRIKGFVNCSIVWYYLLFILFSNAITIHVSFQHRPFEHWLYLPMKLAIQFFLFIMCSFSDYFKIASNDAIHPKDLASIPSRMIFWWFNRLAVLGYRRPLTENDLWLVRKHDSSQYLMKLFYKYADNKNDEKKKNRKSENVNKNDRHGNNNDDNDNANKTGNEQNNMKTKGDAVTVNKKAYNLWKIIFIQMYGSYFVLPSIGRLITELLQLVNPIVLKAMINYTKSSDVEMWHGILYSLTLFFINVTHSLSTVYQQHRFAVLALRIRSTLIGAIYRKSLLLSSQARKDYSTGDIVNLMAIDSQRFIDMVRHVNYLWTGPVLILIGFYLLYQEIGWSVVGGFVLMFLLIPIQGYVTRLIKSIQLKQMKLKDQRIRATNELLNGMKIMKLYSWENAFLKQIQNIRLNELRFIKMAGIITVVFISVSFCSPFLITFIVFTIYTKWQQLLLTSEKAFVTIALFNLLRLPLSQMPNMISSLTLTIISMKRITKFLNADEIENYVHNSPMSNEIAINVSEASFSWDHDEGRPILSDINLKIKTGKLIAVVGQVGSGKSSLLFALLGEMHKCKGSVLFNEKLKTAYVAQQAWIQNLTVRDNIIFGYEFDENRYEKIIKACELESDLKMLDHGDQTEIGEKGINLSGGQKQRISIARACYSDSDLYLFDDPLSAVDSHVGKNLFEQVLSNSKGILKNKTRILVTNALYVLPMVDQIVLLRNGTISDIGSCQELLKNNTFFRELFNSYHQQPHQTEESKHQHHFHDYHLHQRDSSNDRKDSIDMDHHYHHHHHHHHSHHHHHHQTESYIATRRLTLDTLSDSISLSSTSTYDSFEEEEAPQTNNKPKTSGKLVETESIETGTISFAVYKKFITSLTPMWFFLIIICYVLYISFSSGANFRLSDWTNKVDKYGKDDGYELWVYFFIGIMQVIFIACGWLSIVFGCLRASRTLHERLLNSIIHAPMYFFDCTPLGRIMNRFSRDIDIFDNNMSLLIRILIFHTLQVIVTLIIVTIKSPMFLVFVVPFLIIYLFIQRFYVSTTRQLKRIESVTSSPIFTHFAETLNGVSTIKAYNVCQRFIEESNKRVDKNFQCTYPNAVANCWLLIRLEFLSNLLIFFASFMSTLNKLMDGIGLTGSEIGLSLSYALNVTLSLSWFVRVTAELENNIVSVERVSEYINIEAEADWETDHDQLLPIGWPSSGKIDFENYATRYRPGLNLVLKGINLNIQQGEKIGIVGRTGAGKSSLTLGLFRLIEAAGGGIRIDNYDISKLGLHKLRSCLTIIPQEPVLFSGTIRFNLDPFGKYTDEQLWQVLELAHLKTFVASLHSNMDYQVSEDGENLSVGQRQLFCLARALLRHTKVLVLDEATASVDFETDALIQSTIRKEFAECTVLTIAHRLNTIMDSSRVLVLDAGNVAEFDTPKSLLANRASIFYSLAKDAGITHYAFDSKVKQKN